MTTTRKPKAQLPNSAVDVLLGSMYDIDALRCHIVALRGAGWTLESIASPLGMSRERVRQIGNLSIDLAGDSARSKELGLDAPEVPRVERKVYVPAVKPQPSEDNLARLRELQPFVKQVRGRSLAYRHEAEEYTELLNIEHNENGVSLYRLAKELGVTHGALRFRLVRYGYKKTGSESRVYKPILSENRV